MAIGIDGKLETTAADGVLADASQIQVSKGVMLDEKLDELGKGGSGVEIITDENFPESISTTNYNDITALAALGAKSIMISNNGKVGQLCSYALNDAHITVIVDQTLYKYIYNSNNNTISTEKIELSNGGGSGNYYEKQEDVEITKDNIIAPFFVAKEHPNRLVQTAYMPNKIYNVTVDGGDEVYEIELPRKSGTLALLEDIGSGGNVTVDSELSATSENPVQNKAITKEINDLYLIANATVTGTEELTQEYSERQTANGLSGLIDGALTRVTKIQGNTVKSANIFNRYYGTKTGASEIVEKTDEIITVRNEVSGTYRSANIPIANPEQYIGKTLYISANWTVSGTNKGAVRVSWLNDGQGLANGMVAETSTSATTVSGIVPERPENATGLYVLLYSNLNGTGVVGDTVTYTDIMISTENIPYQLYFDGIKNSYFKGVKSTGKNLLDAEKFANDIVAKNPRCSIVTFDGKRCLKLVEAGHAVFADLPKGLIKGIKVKAYVDGEYGTSFFSYKYLNNGTLSTGYIGVGAGVGDTTNMRQWREISRYFSNDTTIESLYNYSANTAENPIYVDLDSFMLETSTTPTEYEPYKTDESFMLENAVELGEWDYIDTATNKLIRQTETLTSETAFTEEQLANYSEYVLSADGLKVAYKTETATETNLEIPTNKYQAWAGGLETVLQGDIDNSEYGVNNTITQTYVVKKGGAE